MSAESLSVRSSVVGSDKRRLGLSPVMMSFMAATVGYSLYYVCRLSFSVVKGALVTDGLFTEFQLGLIGSALFYSYAVGKLVNGFLVDRVNIRKFASIGLLVSAVVNFCLGFHVGFSFFFTLWLINGWCQSMGAGSFVIGLTRLFETRVRGTYYGLWSASHNIGEGLTFLLTSIAVAHWGWRWGWWCSALVGFAGVALIWFFFHADSHHSGRDADLSLDEPQSPQEVRLAQKRLLKNPVVWLIASASLFMYISRYSINSWGIFFLEKAKGYSVEKASMLISISAVCGVLGTVASGWISDRFFRGDRSLPTVYATIINVCAITLFLVAPSQFPAFFAISMALFGVSIGALICYLGGLMAVDLAGKGSAGAALGIVGMASYAGAGTQDIISGFLIGTHKTIIDGQSTYNFLPMGLFWAGSSLLCVAASVATWRLTLRRGSRESEAFPKAE